MSTTFVLPFSGELDGSTALPSELLYKSRPRPEGNFTPMERRAYYPDGYVPAPLVTPIVNMGLIDPLELIENTRARPADTRTGASSYILTLSVCPTDVRNRVIVQIIGADGCLRVEPFILPAPVVVSAVQYLTGTRYAIPIVTGDSIRVLWDPAVGPFPGGGIISASLLPSNTQEANFEDLLVNMTPTSGGGTAPALHAPTHSLGGTDTITVENLGTGSVSTTDVVSPDGAGGLVIRPEASGLDRLDEVLVAGPNTDGADMFFTVDDELVFVSNTSPLADPTIPPPGNTAAFGGTHFAKTFGRTALLPPGAGTMQNVGLILDSGMGMPNGANNVIHVRVVASRKQSSVSAVFTAVLEEIWERDFGTWARIEVILNSASATQFQIAESGGDLYLQAVDNAVASVSVNAKIETLTMPGYTAF